jgi:hypothetical protein
MEFCFQAFAFAIWVAKYNFCIATFRDAQKLPSNTRTLSKAFKLEYPAIEVYINSAELKNQNLVTFS